MTRRGLLPVLLLAAALAGCATSATPTADPHRYTELTPGQATENDAISAMGPPNSISDLGATGRLLQWLDPYAARPIHVALLFGQDHRLIKVQQVTTP